MHWLCDECEHRLTQVHGDNRCPLCRAEIVFSRSQVTFERHAADAEAAASSTLSTSAEAANAVARADAAMAALIAEEEGERTRSSGPKARKRKKKKTKAGSSAEAAADASESTDAAPEAEHAAEEEQPTHAEVDVPAEPPDDLVCPITQELMVDPVIAADGHTYERHAIERWLASKRTSPKTGGEIETCMLFPNHLLRRQSREWQEAYGQAKV